MTCHLVRKILLSLLLVIAAVLSLQATLRPGYVVTWIMPAFESASLYQRVTYTQEPLPPLDDGFAWRISKPKVGYSLQVHRTHRDYGRVALHLVAIWICAFSAIGIVRVTLPRDKAQDPRNQEERGQS